MIGYVAGTLTTFAFIPQVTRIFRTKSSEDLSWWWLSMSSAGILLWLLYGVTIRNYPMILFNVITLILIGSICFAKKKFEECDGILEVEVMKKDND